jgi:nitronate monooxygenase
LNRSTVHDDIQGTGLWPETYDGRAIIGDSFEDFTSGLPTEENVAKYKKAIEVGDVSRKIVWA